MKGELGMGKDSSVWNQLDMSTCGNTEAPKAKPENKYREVDMRRLKEVVVTKLIHPISDGPSLTVNVTLSLSN